MGGETVSNPNVKKFLLVVWGDVEPEILGPYDDEETLEARAVELKREHGNARGIFRLGAEVIGAIEVSSFSNGFTEGHGCERPAQNLACFMPQEDVFDGAW